MPTTLDSSIPTQTSGAFETHIDCPMLTVAATRADRDETVRISDEIKRILGQLPRLFVKLKLTGNWGFLFVMLFGLMPHILNYMLKSDWGSKSAGQEQAILRELFKPENLIKILEALTSMCGVYSLFNAAVLYEQANKAKIENDGELTVRVVSTSFMPMLIKQQPFGVSSSAGGDLDIRTSPS